MPEQVAVEMDVEPFGHMPKSVQVGHRVELTS